MYSFYDLMANGGIHNAGFQALPDYVQNKILANMANGGTASKKMYKQSNFSGNAWYQEGGEEGASQEEQIMQIIEMYAQLTETEPDAILEELQGMSEEEQQQALQSMVEQIQSAQEQQQGDAQEEEMEDVEDDAETEYRRGGQPCYGCGGAMKYQTGGYIPEYGEMAYGGIHINPANKGKFTASAQRAGMGVQEFASQVLANKEDYSSTQVKRANFARNAAGWSKAMGGPVVGQEMEVTPRELENLRKQGYQFEIL
jgi:hypothetical protein